METIKSYTDLEQSKKLAEILPLESADMHYGNFSPKGLGYEYEFRVGLTSYIKEIKVYEELKESYKIKDYNGIVAWRVIPCWSLAALLGVLQKAAYSIDEDADVVLDSYKTVEWRLGINNSDLRLITEPNPIDACYEMIIKLHELKKL